MEGFERMTDTHVNVRMALLERLAQEAADYLQTRFVEEEQMSPEGKSLLGGRNRKAERDSGKEARRAYVLTRQAVVTPTS